MDLLILSMFTKTTPNSRRRSMEDFMDWCWTERAQKRFFSTTGTACTASTTTSRRTPSILPPKRKRSSPCRLDCGRLDLPGLGEFVSCGCVLENRTLFKAFRCCRPRRPGSFDSGAVEEGARISSPASGKSRLLEPEAYYRELRDVFSRKLPRYFSGTRAVGVSLTGGLDTRMIMAWHKAPPGSLPCYTFGGMFRDCQDVVLARQVASVSQPHEVIPVGAGVSFSLSPMRERTVYLTDGCVEVNHAPDLYVNERGPQIAPVRMTGNYGGEVLRRVRAFKPD